MNTDRAYRADCGHGSRVPRPARPRDDGAETSIALVGQDRQRVELDAFLDELGGIGARCLAVDRAMLDLAVMHLSRFLGKFLADVIGVLDDVVAQLLELGAQLAFLRRQHRDGHPWLRGRGGCRRLGCHHFARRAPRHAGRHDRLADLGRAADRAADQAARRLLVVGARAFEPALEAVAAVAAQRIADHVGPPTTWRCEGSAIGSKISKRRPCCSEGMRARASAIAARSTSASTTAGSTPPSASTRPHGSIASEWPNVSRPFSWVPPWAAANTKQPFSMARARSSTCQCASPVCLVNAEGMLRNEAPASASAR